MKLTKKMVRDALADFAARREAIEAVGGIALCDVVDGRAVVPRGWVLDHVMLFYVPATFIWRAGTC